MMLRKDAPEVFTVWILLLQVASQGKKPRGRLIRDNGTPHDFSSLAIKTRTKEAWFKKALPVLVQMGWVISEVVDNVADGTTASSERQDDASKAQAGDEEEKGKKEEKEAVVVALPFPSEAFNAAWENWLAYRNHRRFDPYAPQSIPAQFSKFREWGERGSIDSITDSIRNNWQGLFAPKGNGKQQSFHLPTTSRVGKHVFEDSPTP